MSETTRTGAGRLWAVCYDRIGHHVKCVVRRWRCIDAWALRPLPVRRAPAWQVLAPSEYPFFIPLLTAILVFAVTVGPRPANWRAETLCLFALGLVMMAGVHVLAWRSRPARLALLGWYLAILLALAALLVAVVRMSTDQQFDPEARSLRLHVGPALAVLVAMMLGIVSLAAWGAMRKVDNDTLPSALPVVELFPSKDRSDYVGDTPILSLLSIGGLVLLRYPMQVLLPPALLALLVRPDWVTGASLAAGLAAWLALCLGVVFDRLMEMMKTVGRLFFIGPQRFLSAIVILIAIARWSGSHYVAYIFDNAAGTQTVFFYIFFAYALAWFYGFWCEILLARRFIRLLHPTGASATSIGYSFRGDERVSRVANKFRRIALHGAGRLKVEGRYDAAYRRSEGMVGQRALNFLTPAEMLAEFRVQLEDHAWTGAKDPLPRVRDLQRATYAYPGMTGFLVILFLGVPLYAGYAWTAQAPELDIARNWSGHFDMTSRLLDAVPAGGTGDECELRAGDPRIAVAASGGGTRAAIYTAAVLRGLAQRGHICNVVLVSGVSGGSAALGYFALHQDALRRPVYDAAARAAYDAFDAAMAKPYIQMILNAASDHAVVFGTWHPRHEVCGEAPEGGDTAAADERRGGWWPTRIRFGNLLAESFVCAHEKSARDAGVRDIGATMQDVRFGLILNTGLAGRFEPEARADTNVPEQARLMAGDPARRTDVAGGRLVLANVGEPKPARNMSERGPRDLRFYTLNDPDISVARAAALSANFPPVFADAAIDERWPDRDKRFWVTDGGTVENRGTVTLYLTVEDALANGSDRAGVWPDLHVVIADVSAEGGPYREGVGLATLQAAGGQMGLALEAELLSDLRETYAGHGRICAYELPMPVALRDAIGTHWMMPNGISVAGPDRGEQDLEREEATALVSGLFAGPAVEPTPAQRRVRSWLEKGEENAPATYVLNWARLVGELGSRGQRRLCPDELQGRAK